MRVKSSVRFQGAIVVLLGLVMASCSSDDSASSSTSAAATVPASASTPAGSEGTDSATSAPATTEPATAEPVESTEAPTTEAATTEAPTTIVAAADVPAAPSPACSTATPAAPGDSTIPFTGQGLAGAYIQHLPPTISAGDPLPLVVDLHGYSEPAAVHVLQSGFSTYGDTKGFVTVVPSIDRPVPRWDSNVGSDDVAFIDQLLDEVEGTVCIDTNRVYVAGLSNGAFMTSIVACDLSARLAAVAPVAGIQAPDDCAPERPVPVISFHGTADTFVSYDGGLGTSVADLPSADGTGTLGTAAPSSDAPAPKGPSVPERASTWAVRNGCDPTPAEEPIADDVTLLRFDCPAGDEVLLYRVEGGGHSWPGSAFSQSIASVVGVTTMSIDATQLIWDFFVDHPLRS